MEFKLPFSIQPLHKKIKYSDKIMLVGSCFSTEIGDRLASLKFDILQNPTGIIYHPLIIAEVLERCMDNKKFEAAELFENQGLYHSWLHHSSFSGTNVASTLHRINEWIEKSHKFLSDGNYLIITPATAFGYYLKSSNRMVANCHKMPSAQFEKKLTKSEKICVSLARLVKRIKQFNPKITILFTISPVRHYRDGIIESNISKARIISAVHDSINDFEDVFYFPSYEIMNDELRDYRFYKDDFAHPNKLAVDYILERFMDFGFAEETTSVMKRIRGVISAFQHLPKFPNSEESRLFRRLQLDKINVLIKEYPFLNFEKERMHFENI